MLLCCTLIKCVQPIRTITIVGTHWMVFTSSDITTTQQRSGITRCLIESATPVRLGIVRITSPKGCCTYGRSMFAPVGRGTPGHPDRDRQRHQHPQDRSDARPQRLGGRQGDRTRHVAPVQRERVLTAVPAETAEDGPVDGRILHRRPRAAQGRPQARQIAQAPPARHADARGRGRPNGRVAAGRRRPSAAGRASCSPTTPPCACARRPSAVGSTPTAIAVNAGRAAFHVATGGVAGVAAGGRRVSRFPDGLPSPDARRRPATAAVSAIGRPTA